MGVSIVMATFNGEAYLREQIESLLNNKYKNWDLTIYDDGSTDGTPGIGRAYETEYPGKIRFIRNEKNKGVAINFLEGVKAADADYVMFCDQDDVWLPWKIVHSLIGIKKLELTWGKDTPAVIFTDAAIVDEALGKIAPSFHRFGRLNPKRVDLAHLLMENKMMGCTMLFNRALAEKIKAVPEQARMHDWWIALIAAAFGKIGYLDGAELLYRQHGANVVGSRGFASYVKRMTADRRAQKESLFAAMDQAMEFYELYQEELGEEEKKLVYEFAHLREDGWLRRRMKIIRYGFTKSGVVRNIGLMLAV